MCICIYVYGYIFYISYIYIYICIFYMYIYIYYIDHIYPYYIHISSYIPPLMLLKSSPDFFHRAADADDRLGEHTRIGHLPMAMVTLGNMMINHWILVSPGLSYLQTQQHRQTDQKTIGRNMLELSCVSLTAIAIASYVSDTSYTSYIFKLYKLYKQ